LVMLNLLLTKKCNFRCDYCVEDKELPDDVPWNYTNFDKLCEWIKAQGRPEGARPVVLSFFGGEPLLEWDTIKDFMKRGLDKYPGLVEFNVSTNIVLLDDAKLKWLDENTTGKQMTFLLSLDGFDRVYSRHATGNKKNNLMKLIRKNIQNMKDNYPRLFKCSSFRVSALPEYLDILCEDLYEMVDYGPENIIIHPVTTEPNAPWTEEKYQKLTDTINDLCQYAIETSNVEIECMEGVSKKTHNCGAGHSMLAVNPDGRIYSCYFTAHAEMDMDILGNYMTDAVNIERGNIYQLNPNYDPKCGSCDKKYCFQCSVKNLLHHGQHFCSSMWCKELADLYEQTLEMCNLTRINRQIADEKGITSSQINEEIDCKMNDMVAIVNSILLEQPYKPTDDDCGCHDVDGSRTKVVSLIRDMSSLKLGLEVIHNRKFPDNYISSIG
jgi:radical SAM protein with 4Fe4S-binding SPASM domain